MKSSVYVVGLVLAYTWNFCFDRSNGADWTDGTVSIAVCI